MVAQGWDLKQVNNSVYSVDGERRYVVSDVGATFGKTGSEGAVCGQAGIRFDDAISGMESSTLDEIASELDISREDLTKIRAEFADKFSARFGFHAPPSAEG